MNASLSRWIGQADALVHLRYFGVAQVSIDYAHITTRISDYYISLVGELFERLADAEASSDSWARLGNAFSQFATESLSTTAKLNGIATHEAILFAAASFYQGGFPASAALTIRSLPHPQSHGESTFACYDLLGHPPNMQSATAVAVREILLKGDDAALNALAERVESQAIAAREIGPSEWVPSKLLERLVTRFVSTNLRSVLPDGNAAFWTPLVESFLKRSPPTWEFFPSQIAAISAGLLTSDAVFSLQMPTGAGKTTLCETLLFAHAKRRPDSVAVLLVPYRALASELRSTLVKRLNAMGIKSRCAYGGTVPSSDEVRDLNETRVIVSTPESLGGLLSANREFFQRISLVICDEGHLLDGGGRGIGLELLLARMKARTGGSPRFVFLSAIVPNIEEISAWLGGTREGVVRSDYRPAIAEFARLASSGTGASATVDLLMHPHKQPPTQFAVPQFLSRSDFEWQNPQTGRKNVYSFASNKVRAVATARKALPMGAVALFAANKRGEQGCLALAQELLDQLRYDLKLPRPQDTIHASAVRGVTEYLAAEFGPNWIGTVSLSAGVVVHHGDIPQEARELLEMLLRLKHVAFAVCTSTLAEGVNLPIRTLVLYSVERMQRAGTREPMLGRDIKNLVGRAGRPGSTTKGLVICANERQWPRIADVASQAPGEEVRGALRQLMTRLRDALARANATPTNALLESNAVLLPVVDGIDITLLDLASEEIGTERLADIAAHLADQTYASSQATEASKELLRTVFRLRAARVSAAKTSGRSDWVRSTGTRLRLLESVERTLLPKRPSWTEVENEEFVEDLLEWAWTLPDVTSELRRAFHLTASEKTDAARGQVASVLSGWLDGRRFVDIANQAQLSIDDLLGVHTQVVTFALQTAIEQGIALLGKVIESAGNTLAPEVTRFPDRLRFGTSSNVGCVLASSGVRHRWAYESLGRALADARIVPSSETAVVSAASALLRDAEPHWRSSLGEMIYANTLEDLTP